MRLFDVDLSSDFIINSYKYESNSENTPKRIIVGEKSLMKPPFKTMDRHKDLRTVNNIKKNDKEEEYQSDSSEELQYGPGIVNKLKTKYLSLTLRESQKRGVRPSLSNLRRATSLENILDEESKTSPSKPQSYFKKSPVSSTNKNSKVSQYCARYMSINKGESIKRAQSMDALFRNEAKVPSVMTKSVTVESRLSNGSEVVIIDNFVKEDVYGKLSPKEEVSKELPPPDLVKQTLKIFEKTATKKEAAVVAKVKCVKLKPAPPERKKLTVKPVVLPKPVLQDRKLLSLKKDLVIGSTPPHKADPDYFGRLVSPPAISPIDLDLSPKRVSRKALENIGKEGTSVKFSFGSGPAKPHLPVAQATNTVLLQPPPRESPSKQVAVIRPVVANKPPPLTDLERENNLINKAKTEAEPDPDSCDASEKVVTLWDSKSWQNQNTMVFNFVNNHRDIPDYIENDGLVLTTKKEKSKEMEDPEEESDGEDFSARTINIIGGNVLINGKSNLRKQPRHHKMRIQFNDATTLFEYPREEPSQDEFSPSPTSPTSLLSGGGGLSTYTPSKTVDTFQLGVSRPVPQPPAALPPTPDYLKPLEAETPWSKEASSDLLF